MKKIIPIFIIVLSICFLSCEKNRNVGFCYCKYQTGTNTGHNFSTLDRTEQIDSCNKYNAEAINFGGFCELE